MTLYFNVTEMCLKSGKLLKNWKDLNSLIDNCENPDELYYLKDNNIYLNYVFYEDFTAWLFLECCKI